MAFLHSVKVWQGLTFLVSFLANACKHSCIGAWSMSKSYVAADLGFTSSVFGTFDSVYLVSYSLGNFASGALADHFPIKYVVSIGTSVAALCYFGVISPQMVLLGLLNHASVFGFAVLFALNGLSQSGIYPGGVSVMSNWFSHEVRGRVMGFWSANASVGEAYGQLTGGILFGVFLMSWEGVLAINASVFLVVAGLFLLVVDDRPPQSLHTTALMSTDEIHEQRSDTFQVEEAIGFWQAMQLPG